MKQHLKAFAIVFVLGSLITWAYLAYFTPRLQQAPDALKSLNLMENEGVSDFSATTLDGEAFKLSQFKGKVVILNFWASWCGPCVEEVPSLIKLIKELKGDVELLAISGDSSLEDINVFLKSFPDLKGPNIKVIYDKDRSLMNTFGVTRLPESLVLNSDQKLAKKLVGSINWYTKDSISYMKTLIPK